MIGTALNLADDGRVLRRMRFRRDVSMSGIAAQHGCALEAIALLFPFFIDDDFVTVLASAGRRLSGADILHSFRAASVRRPAAEEVLLGFQLGRRRHTVYIDQALLSQDEVLFCIEPPSEWVAGDPRRLCAELGAHPIALRS